MILSGTITDASGRASGQVTEEVLEFDPARQAARGRPQLRAGRAEMRPYIAEMSRIADTFVSCYPNAGLPNASANDDESPKRQAGYIAEFAGGGFLVNLVGGCCGTTPAHIAEIAKAVEGKPPRPVPPSRSPPGCPAWSRSTSTTTRCSSTSVSAPTSPARPGSAT